MIDCKMTVASILALGLVACSSETASEDRRNVATGDQDASVRDAGAVDPSAGRDDTVSFKLDCVERKVCIGGPPGEPPTTCVAATFSAFSFVFTPAGEATNVCVRD